MLLITRLVNSQGNNGSAKSVTIVCSLCATVFHDLSLLVGLSLVSLARSSVPSITLECSSSCSMHGPSMFSSTLLSLGVHFKLSLFAFSIIS